MWWNQLHSLKHMNKRLFFKNVFCYGLFFFLFKYFIVLLQLSQFFLLCSPPPSPPLSSSQSPHCCPCSWVIHTWCLTSPFPFFPPLPPYLLPSGRCQSVPCFHASGSIMLIWLFCSLGSFFPHHHLVPLYLLPPQSPHCCPCSWVFLPFCSIPPHPDLLPTPLICHPALYFWVCLYFAC